MTVAFLILPNIHLLDLAGPDQVFLEAIDFGLDLTVEYCSFASEVATSSHLPFGNLKYYGDVALKKGDYLIVPGADLTYLLSAELLAQKDLFAWLNDAYERKVNICSICTSAFFLAQAGLLNDRKCTTHWKYTDKLQLKFPKAKVIENILFVEDKGIYTSAGVTAGIDLALHIVSVLKDDNFSFKIARELVVYNRRSGSDAQQSIHLSYRNHIHSGIHKVQDWLQDNLNKALNIIDLAAIANMSDRNFTRIFKKETSLTVHEYITLLRKERLAALLKNPDLSRQQIAQQCGLASERQLSRLIKQS